MRGMKASSGFIVGGLSTVLLSTGWVVGSGVLAPDGVGQTAQADAVVTAASTLTVDGAVVASRYGNFQARLTIEDGVVTVIEWLAAGEADRKSQEIDARAIPVLEERILAAQSAAVDAVSGASFTSAAVSDAVASALAAAGLG